MTPHGGLTSWSSAPGEPGDNGRWAKRQAVDADEQAWAEEWAGGGIRSVAHGAGKKQVGMFACRHRR